VITHQLAIPIVPQRVVVLGASGFLGRALDARLQAASIQTVSLGSADIDLVLPESVPALCRILTPTDTVVMLAALTPDRGRDAATLVNNLAMMKHVLIALEEVGCAHFVYFSSDAVYDKAVSRITETVPASPQDMYGAMHHAREIMAVGTKMPLLILRPTLVYGAEDPHSAYGPNRFHRMAEREGKITLNGKGEELRDHIYVADVAALTVSCLLRRSIGLLNVATGLSTSFHDVAKRVAACFPQPVDIHETSRTTHITHRHFDITDLIKAFPSFCFTSLQEGLACAYSESTGAT
jgi:nucleoside-diphosphate-sugar epimerase